MDGTQGTTNRAKWEPVVLLFVTSWTSRFSSSLFCSVFPALFGLQNGISQTFPLTITKQFLLHVYKNGISNLLPVMR